MTGHDRQKLESYLGRLFGYAVSLANDRDQAEDLVQECALKALSAKKVPVDGGAYRAWLFRILRNAYLDQVRRKPAPDRFVQADGLDAEGEYWDADDRFISVLTVRLELAKLPLPHREIIALVDIAGFSYAEAATYLGVKVGTVMSRLSRARMALLKAVGASNVQALPAREKRRRK